MSILGTRTLAYNIPQARASWESHGKDGFYIGPCYFHYRLMEHFITATRSYIKTLQIDGTFHHSNKKLYKNVVSAVVPNALQDTNYLGSRQINHGSK